VLSFSQAAASGQSVGNKAWTNAGPSVALPFATAPATLDGSMLGDVGFVSFLPADMMDGTN